MRIRIKLATGAERVVEILLPESADRVDWHGIMVASRVAPPYEGVTEFPGTLTLWRRRKDTWNPSWFTWVNVSGGQVWGYDAVYAGQGLRIIGFIGPGSPRAPGEDPGAPGAPRA